MPVIFSPDDFRRDKIPSKRTFKKALGFIRQHLKDIDGIVYASLCGSSAYAKDVSHASDIDLFIVYDSRTEESMQYLRGICVHLNVPIEIHAIPLRFLERGVWASGGSYGDAVRTASKNPLLVVADQSDFNRKLLFQEDLHPISGFFGSKHTKIIKMYAQQQVVENPGRFMPCQYQHFLQKLIQIPYHTMRNVLYYYDPTTPIPETKNKVRARWREVFGVEMLESYEGLFEIERDYKSMVKKFAQTKRFQSEVYAEVIYQFESNTFRYISFVEDAVNLLLTHKTAH